MLSRLKTFVCIGAAAFAATATMRGDQSPASQQPTFVSGTQAVRVDVHVTRDGEPVADLTREEVQISEDGVRQTIQTFERITYARPGSAPTVAPRTLARSLETVADPRSRVFVVFLDRRHTGYVLGYGAERAPSVQARFPIFKTLEKLIGPDDLVALMTPDMRANDLSFDRGLPGLARLEGTWASSPLYPDPAMLRDPKGMLYAACYPPDANGRTPAPEMTARHFEKMAFDALDDLIGHLGALRQEPKHVFAITDGWSIFTENPGLAPRDQEPRLPRNPLGVPGRDDVGVITERGVVNLSDATFRECEADLLALSSLDHRDRLREIAAHANASNVSFYPISARGLTTTPGAAPSASKGAYQNTSVLFGQGLLRGLAEDTGGLAVVNTNNLERMLGDVMTRTSAYYLASYASTNGASDGRYRRIAVKVSRPDVAVRARPGYVATRPPETRTATEPAVRPDPIQVAIGALESQVRRAAEKAAAGIGASSDGSAEVVLFRRGSSPALPFERTIDPRFRRNERLRLAAQKRGTAPSTARLLDRRGGMLAALPQISERPDPAGAIMWIDVELALASLAIGDYAIEVTAGDDVRVVAFRIVP
jgi:VWFA-related protein